MPRTAPSACPPSPGPPRGTHSKQAQLSFPHPFRLRKRLVIEHTPAVEGRRDRELMAPKSCKISLGLHRVFDVLHEPVKPPHPVQLETAVNAGCVQRRPEYPDGFVVSFQGHWEWMPVLAAEREREAGRVVKAPRFSVNDFRDQRHRL